MNQIQRVFVNIARFIDYKKKHDTESNHRFWGGKSKKQAKYYIQTSLWSKIVFIFIYLLLFWY